jgi:hypothetical protein
MLVKIQKSEEHMKFDNSFRKNKRVEIDENKIMNKFDCNNSIKKPIENITNQYFKELIIHL